MRGAAGRPEDVRLALSILVSAGPNAGGPRDAADASGACGSSPHGCRAPGIHSARGRVSRAPARRRTLGGVFPLFDRIPALISAATLVRQAHDDLFATLPDANQLVAEIDWQARAARGFHDDLDHLVRETVQLGFVLDDLREQIASDYRRALDLQRRMLA